MVDHLRGKITSLDQQALEQAAGSRQIKEASDSMAEGATRQAQSLSEINQTVNDLLAACAQSSENGQQAKTLVSQVNDMSAKVSSNSAISMLQ